MTLDASSTCSVCGVDLEGIIYYCVNAFSDGCPSDKVCNSCLCYDCGKCPSCDECIKRQTGNLFCKSCGQVEKHSLASGGQASCDICAHVFYEDALNLQEKWLEGVDYDFLTLVMRLSQGVEEESAWTCGSCGGDEDNCDCDEELTEEEEREAERYRDILYCRKCSENVLHRSLETTEQPPYGSEALECETCGQTRYGRYRLEPDGSVIDIDGRVGKKGAAIQSSYDPHDTPSYRSGYNSPQPTHRGTYYKSCKHWQQEVEVGGYTILCSASADRATVEEADPKPDMGIYFSSWAWGAQVMLTPGFPDSVGLTVATHPRLVYDWEDYNAPRDSVVRHLVKLVARYLREGKRVDIGCMGGHGRTGTFLALLILDLEKCNAKQAIEQVRSRYCPHAIESYSQRAFIYRYNGERPPPGPPTPAAKPAAPTYHYKSRKEKKAAKRRRKKWRRDFKQLIRAAQADGRTRAEVEEDGKFWRCPHCSSIRRDNTTGAGVLQGAKWYTYCAECNKCTQHERPKELYTELSAE